MTVFISVWPVLKSLPAIGMPSRSRASSQSRGSRRQVRRAVGERHALLQARPGVDLRWAMIAGIVLREAASNVAIVRVHFGSASM